MKVGIISGFRRLIAVGERAVNDADIAAVSGYFRKLQQRICAALEAEDGDGRFGSDVWVHPLGGGGCTQMLSDGAVFERAGVNFSHVRGEILPDAASVRHPELSGRSFQALGVSVVVHPRNPYVPTSHFNARLLVAESLNESPCWWFGGGFDLTPYYGFEEDARYWHRMTSEACRPFGGEVYAHFKRWCDEYFYLPHRGEQRGIGGLFYDDLHHWGFARCFAFTRTVGRCYLAAYLPLVQRRKATPFGSREREFQLMRRGRYVEFNLVFDRGTLFGLQSGGRVESILMSLPPTVQWRYNWQPQPGSAEATLYEVFLRPRDWLST